MGSKFDLISDCPFFLQKTTKITALAQAEQLQYLVNVKGERTPVIAPTQAWEQTSNIYQQTPECN